jgi:hypothetical protein
MMVRAKPIYSHWGIKIDLLMLRGLKNVRRLPMATNFLIQKHSGLEMMMDLGFSMPKRSDLNF